MPIAKRATLVEDSGHARISEERVGELLDIAAEVFFEHGYSSASVLEMARRAKASKATFYLRYPTKEELFVAVIRRKTDQAFERFRTLFTEASTPELALTRFAQELFSLVLQPDALSLLRILYMEGRNFPEMGRSFYDQGFGRISSTLTNYLRAQVRAGHLQIDHIQIAVEQFGDGLIGEPLRRMALGFGEMPSQREIDLRIRHAVRSFLAASTSKR